VTRRSPEAAGESPHPPLPIHPWLFGLSPLLSLYVTNHKEVPVLAVVRPALLLLVGVSLLWLLIWGALRRDLARSAAITSALVFWVLAYGRLAEQLHGTVTDLLLMINPDITRAPIDPTTFAIWLLLLGLTLVPILTTRRRYPEISALTMPLNVVSVALVALPLISLASGLLQASQPGRSPYLVRSNRLGDPAQVLSGSPATPTAPDIYFLVLDAYARDDALKRFYGFDNTPFLRELEKRGFYVVRNAHANYDQTGLCLSAALQMDYLTPAAADGPKPASTPTVTDDLFFETSNLKSPAAPFLRKQGYRIVTIMTEEPLAAMLDPDMVLGNPRRTRLTPLEQLLINLTPLALIPRAQQSEYDQHRDELNATWRQTADVARLQPARKFVFAHLLAPHPPFVFGPNGEPTQPKADIVFSLADASEFLKYQSHADYQRGYTGQLTYVNRRTLETIDAIRSASKTPPIIILIGDHGSRQFLDWGSLAKTEPRECFSNLSAYCLPDGAAAKLYGPNATAINSLRLLLDHYFGADYPRLPDRSYYSTVGQPFQFTDVTDKTAQNPAK